MAIGRLGLSLDEFYDMTPSELSGAINSHHEARNLETRHMMEMIRWQTCYLLNVHIPEGKRLKPIDLLRFNWEETPAADTPLSKEQIAAIFEKWDKKKANGV